MVIDRPVSRCGTAKPCGQRHAPTELAIRVLNWAGQALAYEINRELSPILQPDFEYGLNLTGRETAHVDGWEGAVILTLRHLGQTIKVKYET